jgi:hypothetical protein
MTDLTAEEQAAAIAADIYKMDYRQRRTYRGCRVYYRAGHAFVGDGGPTVTIKGVTVAYAYASDAARSIVAGKHLPQVDLNRRVAAMEAAYAEGAREARRRLGMK